MKNRTGLALAAAAAAALLISACGSDPTPTPTAAQQPAATSAPAGGSADGTAPSAEPMPTDDSAEPPTGDSAEPPTDDPTSDITTIDTAPDTSTSSAPPLELDETTATFFSTMCTGLSSVLTNQFPEYDASKPAEEQRQAAVEMFTKVGEAMGSTAGQLQQIPPPTFDRGDEVAAAVISTFSKASTAAAQGAADIAAASDADLEKTIDEAENNFDEAGDELDAVDDVMGQPGMEEALALIPACQPMFGM